MAVLAALVLWARPAAGLNLVIVNQSGAEAELTWKPGALDAEETVTSGGCESKSILLEHEWRLQANNLDMNSRSVQLPSTTKVVELEIWLDPDGSSRTVGPREVDQPVNAPYPSACAPVP